MQGRWISPDPAGLAAVDPSNPQTWNRYGYVGNDSLSLSDLLGLADDNNPLWIFRTNVWACPSSQGTIRVNGVDICGDNAMLLYIMAQISQFQQCASDPACLAGNNGGSSNGGSGGNGGNNGGGTQNNGKPLTPAQCQAAQILLDREAKSGTTVAAWQSAIGFGDNTLRPFNSSDPGNAYANTAAGVVKVDWFTNIRMSTLIPGPQVAAYMIGKVVWTGERLYTHAPITNYLPFQDPVETRTMALALKGLGFRDLFTPQFMKASCGAGSVGGGGGNSF